MATKRKNYLIKLYRRGVNQNHCIKVVPITGGYAAAEGMAQSYRGDCDFVDVYKLTSNREGKEGRLFMRRFEF